MSRGILTLKVNKKMIRWATDFILLLLIHWYIFLRTGSREQIDSFIAFMLDYLSNISDKKKWKNKLNDSSIFKNLLNILAKLIFPNQKKKKCYQSNEFCLKMKQICCLKTDSWANKHCYKINNFIYILVKVCNCVGCRDCSFSEPKSTLQNPNTQNKQNTQTPQ